MKFLIGFGRFWYDFVIGDDWKIAAAVVAALAVTLAVLGLDIATGTAVPVIGAVLLITFFSISLLVDTRGKR